MTAVSQRKFAEQIGRSNVWVSRLVKAGRLPTTADGKIPLAEGLKAYEASQRVGYEANRAHGEKQRAAAKAGKPAPTKRASRPAPPAEPPLELPEDDDTPATTGNITQAKLAEQFNKARTAEKTYQAKLKQLEYEAAQGKSIPRDEVEADARQTGEAIIERMRSIPPRVANLCEGKTAREIESIVDDAINEALAALQKSRFAKD